MTDGRGVPLSVVISGANTHDIKLLEETLQGIVIFRPLPTMKNPQNLCLDAGFVGSQATVESYGYTAHIRPRGEEKKELECNPDFKARRWVVEVCHSWLNRFRKLLVRFEKKSLNYLALVQFACALIAWRQFMRIHK